MSATSRIPRPGTSGRIAGRADPAVGASASGARPDGMRLVGGCPVGTAGARKATVHETVVRYSAVRTAGCPQRTAR